MSTTSLSYSAAKEAAALKPEDYEPTNLDVLRLEISCVKGNKWLTNDEKRGKYKLLKNDFAPNMPEHLFEALLN